MLSHRGLLVCATMWALGAPSARAQAPRAPDVRYVPTPQNVVEAMLALAAVTAADTVIDLGSGDGRIPITAAQRYGAAGLGVDLDAARVHEANENARRAGVADRVRFERRDVFETDVRGASVVTLFLLPWMNMRLMPRLQRELPAGARIVSHHFLMGDEWPPDRAEDVGGLMIYLWTVKGTTALPSSDPR